MNSFPSEAAANANYPKVIVAQDSAEHRPPAPTGEVGQGLRDEFERRLKALRHLREMALRRWERYGWAADRAQADAYEAEMDAMSAARGRTP